MRIAATTPRNRNRKPPLAKQGPGASVYARSKVTNGSSLFADSVADGRRGWSRRMRDLIAFYVAHLGGEDLTSVAERSIIRRAATIEIELEWLERKFALSDKGASSEDLDLYSRTTNTLRRLLESIGLRRVARDITPTLSDYLNERVVDDEIIEDVEVSP
jgi:hypothetical protein